MFVATNQPMSQILNWHMCPCCQPAASCCRRSWLAQDGTLGPYWGGQADEVVITLTSYHWEDWIWSLGSPHCSWVWLPIHMWCDLTGFFQKTGRDYIHMGVLHLRILTTYIYPISFLTDTSPPKFSSPWNWTWDPLHPDPLPMAPMPSHSCDAAWAAILYI